ncbi:MAG: hypothetical protein KC591_07425 [Gemmatimonadetes bacterium]|nr:hypothetical protein [Gemmatimonadota bacterium]
MRRTFEITLLGALLAAMSLADAAPALAGSRVKTRVYRVPPSHSYQRAHTPPTFAAIKVGGYAFTGGDAGDALGGLLLGGEVGVRPSPYVEFGLTADWVRRRNARSEVFLLDTPYDLPVEGVIDLERSETDLVPIGGLFRVRFPNANAPIVPFVTGALTVDLLRMGASESTPSGQLVFDDAEYFTGLGGTIAAGLEGAIAPGASLLFEAGYHHSRPDKEVDWFGDPIRARVDASGGYARIGVTFSAG